MAINIEQSVRRSNFENRIASGWVDGTRITVQVRLGDNRFGGDPYVVAGSAGNRQHEPFHTIPDAVSRFEELKDEYGLEE